MAEVIAILIIFCTLLIGPSLILGGYLIAKKQEKHYSLRYPPSNELVALTISFGVGITAIEILLAIQLIFVWAIITLIK